MALARVAGAAERYSIGGRRDASRDEALAAVHAITRDRLVPGVALGTALVDPTGMNGPLIDLYRAAGADEQAAEAHTADYREWLRKHRRISRRTLGRPGTGAVHVDGGGLAVSRMNQTRTGLVIEIGAGKMNRGRRHRS